MRQHARTAVTTLAAATLAVSATAATATTIRPTDQVPVTAGSVDWGTCSDTVLTKKYSIQCGAISVPLDHDHPDGQRITIAVSRLRHTVPDDQYQGVMLVNPGGPGGSGLSMPTLERYVPHGAGAAYDWIGFDPRGVGASRPALSCDPLYFGYDRPRYVPTSRAIEAQWRAKVLDYTADCGRANSSELLSHLTTRDSALDMDAIRRALGQRQINYYGFSYGTYLGEVYSTLFPQRVRRQIFDGTVDPRGVWYQGNLDQDEPFDRNMGIWFGWLARHDAAYHLGATRDAVRSLFYRTQERLYREPVRAEGGRLGGSEWSDAFLFAGYYQATWTDLADVFSGFVNHGEVSALESAYLDANGYGDDNEYAVYSGVQCTDARWPQNWARWRRDNWRLQAVAPYETWANAWYNATCLSWPTPARQPVAIDGSRVASTLMINETLDAATPYSGSLEVRRLFPGARLLAEPGGTTHAGSLSGDACVDDTIADYLATGALPARAPGDRADATCAPLPEPEPQTAADSSRSMAKAPSAAITRLDLQELSLPSR